MSKVRILFQPPVDVDNTNAQSLNVREIVLRLDPARFDCTLWYWREPDPRLRDQPFIRLLPLPRRRKTFRILRELLSGYDLIAYMDYSPASYLYLRAPRSLRRKTKVVFHAEAPMAQLVNPPRLLRFLVQGTTARGDIHTGITPYVARDIGEAVHREVRYVLPVGVDLDFFSPPAHRSNATPTVLFAGTLIERKGPMLVLDAAARFPNVKFRLVGKGRDGYDDALRAKAREWRLTNVAFEGARPQAEVAEIMRQCDIFLLPSRLEGLPKVTLEASASGLPCIVFRDYETPSVIDGVTGFQVSTTEEMMDRLQELIANPALRSKMGESARLHARKFDWDTVARLWEEAYLEIAARP
ncbi:MAG TPA: glycosyltransferase family 4 protein [Terriglobales bacterium]|jgi:glycosyltransferase involved in cell wall biosynthesis